MEIKNMNQQINEESLDWPADELRKKATTSVSVFHAQHIHILTQLVNRPLPNCPSLCFKARLSAKPLI